jgi:Rrf2 family cysteine metabolism transcriptional repressor
MLDLALHYGSGPISIKDIAKRQELSDRYLENLMIPLVSQGLVISSRGKGGGFT